MSQEFDEGRHKFEAIYGKDGTLLFNNLFEKRQLSFEEFKKSCWSLILTDHFHYAEFEDSGLMMLELGETQFQIDPINHPSIHQFFLNACEIMENYPNSLSFEKINPEELNLFLEVYQKKKNKIAKRKAKEKVYRLEENSSAKNLEVKYQKTRLFLFLVSVVINHFIDKTLLAFSLEPVVAFFVAAGICIPIAFLDQIQVLFSTQIEKKKITADFNKVMKYYKLYCDAKEAEFINQNGKDKSSRDIFVSEFRKSMEELILQVSRLEPNKRKNYVHELEQLNTFYFERLKQIRTESGNENADELNLFSFIQSRFYEMDLKIQNDLAKQENIQTLDEQQSSVTELLGKVASVNDELTLDINPPTLDGGPKLIKKL